MFLNISRNKRDSYFVIRGPVKKKLKRIYGLIGYILTYKGASWFDHEE